MIKILFWIIIIGGIYYFITTKNRFNELSQSIKHGGSMIGIQKAKRAECLNDALQIAKLSYEKEVSGIEKLTANDRLEQLAFLGQKYPDLQSIQGYNQALNQAYELNQEIAASRSLLDGNIRRYNTEIANFPGCIIASIFDYKPETFIDEENYEENKKLNKEEVHFDKF